METGKSPNPHLESVTIDCKVCPLPADPHRLYVNCCIAVEEPKRRINQRLLFIVMPSISVPWTSLRRISSSSRKMGMGRRHAESSHLVNGSAHALRSCRGLACTVPPAGWRGVRSLVWIVDSVYWDWLGWETGFYIG